MRVLGDEPFMILFEYAIIALIIIVLAVMALVEPYKEEITVAEKKLLLETAFRRTYEADEAWMLGHQEELNNRRELLAEKGRLVARIQEIDKELGESLGSHDG